MHVSSLRGFSESFRRILPSIKLKPGAFFSIIFSHNCILNLSDIDFVDRYAYLIRLLAMFQYSFQSRIHEIRFLDM